MFETYTEKARRSIYFARYEANQVGSPYIETEHLLLGLLRENEALIKPFLPPNASLKSIRKQIELHSTGREKMPTSVNIPLTNESKRVLVYAAEEAERLSHKHIGPEHWVLGLLREENCFAAKLLCECGLELSSVRDKVVNNAARSHLYRPQPELPERGPSTRIRFMRILKQVFNRLPKH